MENEERIQAEITTNTIKNLLYQFDRLLLGLDTNKYSFKNKLEQNNKVKSIKDYADYRLKEKMIDQKSDIWKLLKEIKTKKIEIKSTSLDILQKLIYLYTKGRRGPPINLNSKEAKQISNYLKQKAREDNLKRGDGVLSRLFRFI